MFSLKYTPFQNYLSALNPINLHYDTITYFSRLRVFALACALPLTSWAQQIVSGIVTDENNIQLPGAAVVVQNTTRGTTTDFDGKYQIQANEGDTLIFTYVGYTTQLVTVGSSTIINVQMQISGQLEEVVVTALGISKEKKAIGYAVQQIDQEVLEKIPEINPVQALAGKVAGLSVISSSGTPGSSSKILIRGASTFSGETQPLVVIDGIPINNETTQSIGRDFPFNENLQGVNNSNRAIDINPDDIASVTVLKGAAAAALYGSRAGNGVILYTTKKGVLSDGQKSGLGVRISSSIEFNQVSQLPNLQSTYAQGSNGEHSTTSSLSWGPKIGDNNDLTTYDNIDNFFETGFSNSINGSIVGGNSKTSFRLSLENTDQQGMMPNTFFERTSVRITGSQKVSEKFSYSGTMAFINSKNRSAQNGSNLAGVMLGLLRTSPSFDNSVYENSDGTNRSYNGFYDNPLFTVNRNPFDSEVNRVMGNAQLNLNLSPYFNLSYKAGIDAYSDQRRQIFSVSSFQNNSGDGSGEVSFNNLISTDFYADTIINGSFEFNDKHDVSYTLGHNIFYQNFADHYERGEGFAVKQGYYNLDNTSNRYASNYDENTFSTALFYQLEYNYSDEVYLTLTGRNESSSTFGKNKSSFFYPSFSASWLFHETLNLESSWFNFGKIRASYAEVGITPEPYNNRNFFVSPFFTDGFTNGLSFPYGNSIGFGYSRTLGNEDLEPELKKGLEFGISLTFLNRIEFDLTYFQEKTEGILILRPISKASGFAFAYGNSGELDNKGHEITLSGDLIKSENFKWNLTLNQSAYKNETLKLADGVDQVSIESAFSSIGSYAIVGEPVGVFFGTKWKRNSNGQLIIDSNGIPLKEDEQGNVGNPNPDWTGGVRNTFTYKNFSLSSFFDIRQGGDVYNGTYARLNRFGMTQESAERRNGTYLIPGVKADGTPNDVEISPVDYFQKYVGDGGGAAEQFVETVDWVRLRDVSLSYNVNKETAKKIGLESLTFTASGRNLWLSTNYKGVDPETSLTGAGSNIGGLDYFNNPGSKSYRFTISLTF